MTNTHKASLLRMFLFALVWAWTKITKTEPPMTEFILITVMFEWCVLTCPWIKEKKKDVE
jgi:hypothetical protein